MSEWSGLCLFLQQRKPGRKETGRLPWEESAAARSGQDQALLHVPRQLGDDMGKPRAMEGGMQEWTVSAVAQLRYNPRAQTWMLYRRDRNTKWHEHKGLAPVKNLDLILAELDRDPTGIYWG